MGPIIPANQTRQNYAKMIGDQLSEGMKAYLGQQKLERENQALRGRGIDVSGITDPETRAQIIAHELQFGKGKRKAESTRGFFGEGSKETYPSSQRENLPGFMEGTTKKTTSFDSSKDEFQPSKRAKVLTPQEVIQQGISLARMSTDSDNPMSDEQGIQTIHSMNEQARQVNNEQIAIENHYGDIGEGAIASHYKEASPEIRTIFRKKGEEAAESGKSEAEIQKELVKEAVRLKNQIANIKKSVKPTTLFSKLGRKLTGTERTQEKEEEHLRKELKPLLDEGLYDEARSILSEGGLYPEQRERVITDLSEPTKKQLVQFPNIKKNVPSKMEPKKKVGLGGWGFVTQGAIEKELEKSSSYTPEQMGTINDAVKNIFMSEPKANLILLRKEFEKKGVDWQGFKDAIDQGILEGYINLEDEDQFNMYSDLQEPPLSDLEEMMYKLNLIGR